MTKEKESQFRPAYHGSLVLVIVQQSLLGLLAGMILDGGVISSIFFFSLAAYWAGFTMIIVRRPKNPTKLDVFLIRWGTFLSFAVALAMSPPIWSLRGAM